MKSKRFDELKSTGLLPSPTGVGLEILRLTRTEEASIDSISRVLQADPALTGRILKYANNGNAASQRPVTNVRDAVVRIGLRTVNGIALGFSLLSSSLHGGCSRFDYRRYWSHSLAMALGCQALVRKSSSITPDEGFLAGLLADVGQLALATVHPEKYSEVLATVGTGNRGDLLRLEQVYFSTNHNELTAAMLDDWGLPEFFSAAVIQHEMANDNTFPERSKEWWLARLLYVANSLADICVANDDRSAAVAASELLNRAEQLGIEVNEFISIVDKTIEQWQEWGRMLGVDTRLLPTFQELLTRATSSDGDTKGTTSPTIAPPLSGNLVRQPRNRQSADENPRSEDADSGPSSEAQNDESITERYESNTQRATEKSIGGKRLRILVADDEPVTRHVLTSLLRSSGHEVIRASDGTEALRLALESNPQLIITDWNMPETDGIQLCRAVRATAFGRQTYIIVLTSHADDEHLVEAFEAGADDYVVKPFQARALFARIRAGLRVIKLQEEITREKEQSEKISAELAIANRRLEMDALTDMLTGLPNRRYFAERLSHDWIISRRSGEPLACMVLDIDHFKWINDNYGHDVGDRVLQCVANTLRAGARGTDIVCRYGGEEFVIIRIDSDRSICQQAERLRQAVQTDVTKVFPQLGRQITVSIGVAVRNERTRSPEALVKSADEAMYLAKQSGRNQVCRAGKDTAANLEGTGAGI